MFTRRRFLESTIASGATASALGLMPAWARSASTGNKGIFEIAGTEFDLAIDHSPVNIGGRRGHAITINGTLPGPLLRFREGEKMTLRVKNMLEEDTSPASRRARPSPMNTPSRNRAPIGIIPIPAYRNKAAITDR